MLTVLSPYGTGTLQVYKSYLSTGTGTGTGYPLDRNPAAPPWPSVVDRGVAPWPDIEDPMTCYPYLVALFAGGGILVALLCVPFIGVGEEQVLIKSTFARAHQPPHTPTFACMDFVCVNISVGEQSLLPDMRGTRVFHSFSSCVSHCVVSSLSTADAAIATTPSQEKPAAWPQAKAKPEALQSPPAAAGPSSIDQMAPPPSLRGLGRVEVGNQSLTGALHEWLEAHHRSPCDPQTRVYFAPFSPNGIGNKLMGMVMAFHMSLMLGRRLVVSDWPPRTLDTAYKLKELLQPSSCQKLFDEDKARPAVTKCTVIACPSRTASVFRSSITQPHWAHMSSLFLDLP